MTPTHQTNSTNYIGTIEICLNLLKNFLNLFTFTGDFLAYINAWICIGGCYIYDVFSLLCCIIVVIVCRC